MGAVFHKLFGFFHGQEFVARRPLPAASFIEPCPGRDLDHGGASDLTELSHDLGFGSVGHGNNADNTSHPDDDSQDGQDGPERVAPETP